MDFYQVLEKRRTIRDFSDKEVTDEVLEKVLSVAFKAPTNDHMRQFEFIVVRGQENIARLISPVAENTKNIQQTGLEAAAGVMDKDGYAMFVDAFYRFSDKKIVLYVTRQTKVHSIISLRHGRQ